MDRPGPGRLRRSLFLRPCPNFLGGDPCLSPCDIFSEWRSEFANKGEFRGRERKKLSFRGFLPVDLSKDYFTEEGTNGERDRRDSGVFLRRKELSKRVDRSGVIGPPNKRSRVVVFCSTVGWGMGVAPGLVYLCRGTLRLPRYSSNSFLVRSVERLRNDTS